MITDVNQVQYKQRVRPRDPDLLLSRGSVEPTKARRTVLDAGESLQGTVLVNPK